MSAKLKKQALQLLADRPLTLEELAVKMDLKQKRAFKILRSLFQKRQIISFKDPNNMRRYRISDIES